MVQGTLSVNAICRVSVVQRTQQFLNALVVLATFDTDGTLTARSRPPRLPEVHIYASEYDAIGRARETFGPWNYRGDRYAEWHAADGVELTVYLARDEEWDA